jgi:hypothetical protein
MKNKCYPAGIANRRGDWVWQGTVVASTIKEAKKMISEFKKQMKYSGKPEVSSYFSQQTNRGSGVYESMMIH